MIQPQFAPTSRRTLRALPVTATIDLLGLLLVGGFVAERMLPFPEANTFVLLLLGSSVFCWLAIGQIRTSWSSYFPWGYRFLLVPVVASALTVLIAASMRDYYSGTALVTFAAGWSLWIATSRYVISRYSPRIRILWAGSLTNELTSNDYPELDIEIAARPPEAWKKWDSVVMSEGAMESEEWRAWRLHAELANAEILSEHKAYEMLTGRLPLSVMRVDLLPIAFRKPGSYIHVQRALDLAAVILFSPFIILLSALVALVVRLDAGAPVLYTQLRVGRRGEPFRIYKFRTMKQEDESKGPSFTIHDDPRVTKVGGLLRKFRLDELPQFFNVLRGDMSIIGPRPEQVPFVRDFERLIPLYGHRHAVRPGITGWAQVSQGYAADTNETRDKLSYDLYYVKHQSFLLDALIVVRTLQTILSGFGAR